MSQGTSVEEGVEVVPETALDERARGQHIIDADFHLEISEEQLIEYIEDDRVQNKISKVGAPAPKRRYPGVSLKHATDQTGHLAKHHGEAITTSEITEVMDDWALDEVIITPPNFLPFHLTNYPKISTELVKSYHQYLFDKVIDVDKGIYANLVLPRWEPQRAAEIVEEVAKEDGIVGAHTFITEKLLGSTDYDPIYEALVKHDLPLVCHQGSQRVSELIDDQITAFFEQSTVGFNKNLTANVANMISTGTFDRFPELKVVWMEAGNLWISSLANRMDDYLQMMSKDVQFVPRMYEDGLKSYQKMPSEYIYDNMYASTQPFHVPNKSDLAKATLKANKADEMFIFSTDWPHPTTDTTKLLFETPGMDDEMRSRICEENARDVFRLPN